MIRAHMSPMRKMTKAKSVGLRMIGSCLEALPGLSFSAGTNSEEEKLPL